MSTIAALIIFSAAGAAICVKARAAVPALIFGAFALVLFCTTPLGSGLPGALADVAGWVGDTGAGVAAASAEEG